MGRKMTSGAVVVALMGAAWCFGGGSTPAGAAGVPGVGFATSDFATGFSDPGACCGPVGIIFDSQDRLLVGHYLEGKLYRFPATGGTASGNLVGTVGGRLTGLAFGKDGKLYAAQQDLGKVVELDPANAAIVRTVATITGATGLATDPLSGDLFVTGGGSNIARISNPASSPTTSVYASPGGSDGITFAGDGTIYTATNGCVVRTAGTDQPQPPAITQIACVSALDGIALSNTSTPGQPLLFTNDNDGSVTRVDTSTNPPTLARIVTGGTRGDFVTVGPDGCLYATQIRSVEKVTKGDGTCSFVPTAVVPQLQMKPATYAPTLVGTTRTFTAQAANVAAPSGIDVTFTVTGANPRTAHATTSATGKATFSYAGANLGVDSVRATATAGATSLVSNFSTLRWEDATLTLPASATYHQNVSFSGAGYQPGELVDVWWEAAGTKLLTTVTAGGAGAVGGSFLVPSAGAAYHPVVAVGRTSTRTGYATLQVLPTLSVVPTAAGVGALALAVVHGYSPSEIIDFSFNNGVFATQTATANGSAGASIAVPTVPTGTYNITAVGRSSGIVLTKTMTTRTTVATSPRNGAAGIDLAVYGNGFAPNSTVTVKWDCATAGCASTTVLGTAPTDSVGRFTLVDAVVPAGAGAHTIGVIGGAATFGTATFTES